MSGRLQDKIAVVTGASSGIGQAIALAYHTEGAKVVCADIREGSPGVESASFTHNRIASSGGQAIFVECNVAHPEQVEALVQRAVAWGGRLDVMVNNAGVGIEGRLNTYIWDCDVETWDATHLINARGVFLGTKYATAQMLKQAPHASGDRGWVINTASILGLVSNPRAPAYTASKHAVVGLTRSAALACGPHRIHVNCICPGYTTTGMTEKTFSDPEMVKTLIGQHGFGERLGEPEDLARACVFLASEDARWVTGVALPVDGGFTAR